MTGIPPVPILPARRIPDEPMTFATRQAAHSDFNLRRGNAVIVLVVLLATVIGAGLAVGAGVGGCVKRASLSASIRASYAALSS